ncbi:sensor histidine kinase [Nocardioides sp. Bht2]|uniref:sensor histidine kinase n=1 Tax=Nocardioides sp. Bht2 TaxID=3392297 RepID=UPI0039B555FC
MWAGVARSARRWRDTVQSASLAHGLFYPWWIAVSCAVLTTSAALLGVTQRGVFAEGDLLVLAPLVVLAPYLIQFSTTRWLPWWVTLGLVAVGVSWILTDPHESPYDLAPAAFAFAVAGVTATDGAKVGAVGCLVTFTVLAVSLPWEIGLVVYSLEALVGFLVGVMLRWQMRALLAEHAAREEDRARSALAERQRIAREIHDLVAHSLSVTMLHITGARRVLSDPEPDVDDAISALRDAEQIGREAMAEIRRTVGLLGQGDGVAVIEPLPTATDLPVLVAGFAAAGVPLTVQSRGDLSTLDDAAGLGLYRIVQESLTNAVRHAPGSGVSLTIDATGPEVRVSVRNRVRGLSPEAAAGAGGAGLRGMRVRAEQMGATLTTGETDGTWAVELVVPEHRDAVRRRQEVGR